MKKSYFGQLGIFLLGMASLLMTVSASAQEDCCDECAGYGDCPVGPPILGHRGFGPGLPAGGFANSDYGRRAIPAPVYFANTYPEYLYGSPNIYAGFDEYDTDVAFVSPVVSKTPFHYDYYNDQYNYSPYYGKHWDKNWYITDQVAYRNDDSTVEAGAIAESVSYGDSDQGAISLPREAENSGVIRTEPTETPAVPTESAAPESANTHITQTSYTVSSYEGTYQGRFIYNFESFCDDDPPFYLFRSIARVARAIFGCGGCVSCVGYDSCGGCGGYSNGGSGRSYNGRFGRYCCEAYSGHGGYGGFNCPGYRVGGCGRSFIDPFDEGYTTGTYGTNNDGIYIDSYSNCDNGIFVDGSACGCGIVTDAESEQGEAASKDDSSDTSEPAENGHISTEPATENTTSLSNEENSNLIPQDTGSAEPAVPDQDAPARSVPARPSELTVPDEPEPPVLPETGPESDDTFRGVFGPISNNSKPEEVLSVGSIRMQVPENAVVIINGYRTKLTGEMRTFVAKDLVPGEIYEFEVKVLVERDGKIFSGTKQTELRAGGSSLVAFDLRDFQQEKGLTIASK